LAAAGVQSGFINLSVAVLLIAAFFAAVLDFVHPLS
jgi:hypothetical protein